MNAVEVLSKAKDLLGDERRWVQGTNFADADGRRVPHGQEADCERCCILGALAVVEGIETYGKRTEAEQALSLALYGHMAGSIVGWNDDPKRTHADVIAALDQAVAASTEGAQDA